ncbi:MAG: PKD domain-containing protein [Candidatus Poseidoniaceae archaeon]
MSMTVPVLSKLETTSDVAAIFSGNHLSVAQVDGILRIDDLEINFPPLTSLFETQFGDIIVGSRDGLHIIREGEQIKFVEFLSGIESITGKGDYCVAIDGLSKAHVVNSSGDLAPILVNSVSMVAIGDSIAIATDSGEVMTYSTDSSKIWQRPVRGEVGERITAIGWDGQTLIVAREGHGLVPGEEEALEVEFWKNENLERRIDTKSRVISIDGQWMGLDYGGVLKGEKLVAELTYPVHTLIDRGNSVLAASWFHVHCIDENGIKWSVETQGMAEKVSSNQDGSKVMIAGSDQNDFTTSEPVFLIDANSEPVPLVEEDTAINDWGSAPSIEISAEEIYGSEKSLEELAGFDSQVKLDEGAIFDALNDEIIQNEEIEEEDDLMLALSLDAETIIAPTPNAGGDISVDSGDDGTSIITLDGSQTEDPQERIVSWSWIDQTGKEISTSQVVKVKLNKGSHNFELRIKDKDGRWSSDSIDVRVK